MFKNYKKEAKYWKERHHKELQENIKLFNENVDLYRQLNELKYFSIISEEEPEHIGNEYRHYPKEKETIKIKLSEEESEYIGEWEKDLIKRIKSGEVGIIEDGEEMYFSTIHEDTDLFEMIDKLKEDELKRRKNKIEPKKIEKLEPIYKIEQDMNLDSVIAWQKVNNRIFQKKIDEIIDYINGGNNE